jgi:hypothetical protein
MTRWSWLMAVGLGVVLLGGGGARAGTGQSARGGEATVWALAKARIYHCPGSRWYGAAGGAEIPECRAIREGYRPAFGATCGSACPR